MLVLAHDFPQTTPDTIANYRASEATRSNEADATRAGILDCRRAKHQKFAVPYQAVALYALVFGCARQAASF
jgi:hypothetical protein